MKVDSKNFKGIEYVQLNELPLPQRDTLIKTINTDLFIKIMIDGKVISHCLQYRDYCKWYTETYLSKLTVAPKAVEDTGMDIKADLALNN